MSSEVGDAIDEARLAYAEAASDFFPDACTVSVPSAPTAFRGQFATGESTNIENVPCSYKGLNAYEQATGGALLGGATHVLEMPVLWQGAYLNIPATATVTVNARNLNPALTFSVTGALPTSSRMKQRVAATLNT